MVVAPFDHHAPNFPDPLLALMWKTVSEDCNLACEYWYYSASRGQSRARHNRIDPALLEKTIREYMTQTAGSATFLWQGGEPLLAGLDFFEQAVALQAHYAPANTIISSALQTNGTLLNADWARFFRRYRFLIGISLDGPRETHDRYRVTTTGRGSFDLIMRKLQHLHGRFLCDAFDVWYNDGMPEMSVGLFDSLVSACAGRPSSTCTHSSACSKTLVLEQNGDVYPCDFYLDAPWKLGNIGSNTLRQILSRPRYGRFLVLVFVQPETVIAWQRKRFRDHWTRMGRAGKPGRPLISEEIRELIRKVSRANPLWGTPRIVGELGKLGIKVAKSTVDKYRVRSGKTPSPTWKAFLKNHVNDLVSIDFFIVPTIRFKLLFVLVVLAHSRRKILHFNVTENPMAQWTSQQIVEAFPWDCAPKYLLRDRDAIYDRAFQNRVHAMGIKQVLSAPRSPWQNPFVERLIGTLRRDCLDHVIVQNERHLRRIVARYLDYYADWRTHLSLSMDAPNPRTVHPPEQGRVVQFPELADCITTMNGWPRNRIQGRSVTGRATSYREGRGPAP